MALASPFTFVQLMFCALSPTGISPGGVQCPCHSIPILVSWELPLPWTSVQAASLTFSCSLPWPYQRRTGCQWLVWDVRGALEELELPEWLLDCDPEFLAWNSCTLSAEWQECLPFSISSV